MSWMDPGDLLVAVVRQAAARIRCGVGRSHQWESLEWLGTHRGDLVRERGFRCARCGKHVPVERMPL